MTRAHIWKIHFFGNRFISNYFDHGLGFKLAYKLSDVSQWTHRIGACGGTFVTPYGILTSPAYPDKYPHNADCVYTILLPNDTNINITILQLDTEKCYDYLEVRDGYSGKSPLMAKLCGGETPPLIQPSQNNVWIRQGISSYY